MARSPSEDDAGPPTCSFCQKEETRKRKVVRRADGLSICDECVERVITALSDDELRKLARG